MSDIYGGSSGGVWGVDDQVEDVHDRVTDLINNAPAELNTLNELAIALQDGDDVAAALAVSLSLKAPLDAPTFTGRIMHRPVFNGNSPHTDVMALFGDVVYTMGCLLNLTRGLLVGGQICSKYVKCISLSWIMEILQGLIH